MADRSVSTQNRHLALGRTADEVERHPAYVGGITDRGAPCYGEDNEYVLGALLGYSTNDIRNFAKDGVTRLRNLIVPLLVSSYHVLGTQHSGSGLLESPGQGARLSVPRP